MSEPTQPIPGWTPPSQPTPTPGTSAPSPRHGPSPIPTQHTPVWGPPAPTRPLPMYGAPPGPGLPPGHHGSSGPAPWVWPAVAVLALLVGLLGGAIGAIVVDEVTSAQPGEVPGGLDAVQTREAPPLDADNGSVAAVAQALLPSTVQVLATYEGEEGGATGSGFVLDKQGHIVTNNHVVASAAADEEGKITIVDHDGRQYDATVVGRSPVYDLAVLHTADAKQLAPAALGASEVLHVGEPVVAFGAPLGLSQTVTAGIVSALDRPVTTGDEENKSSYINAVQTDAAINPGNSGGPLVNLSGEVVGVNSAIATTGGALTGSGGNIGVGFAIPIEQVRITADQILRTGEARYPVIGAQVRVGGSTLNGARITEVMPDTPAEDAGLRRDDVVIAVNGEQVTDGIALIVAIRTHQPGEVIEFTVRRAGRERVVELKLDGEVG